MASLSTAAPTEGRCEVTDQLVATDQQLAKDRGTGNTKLLCQLARRYWPLLGILWLMHLGIGLCISMTGPALPYLALNANSSLGDTGILYTVRSLVVCIASVLTGCLIPRLGGSSRGKLALQLIGSCSSIGSVLLAPHMRSLLALILSQCLLGLSIGINDTVGNMLVIFLFGPVLSRAFSHSLHFCAGIGGFLAPLVARPFLVQMGDVAADSNICGDLGEGDGGAGGNVTTSPPSSVNLEPLKWPFIITGCLHLVWILGYGILLARNFQLLRFSPPTKATPEAEEGDVALSTQPEMPVRRKATVVVLFIFFFFLHVGQENMFWSHLYSFGVCSRLRLSPGDASLLSTVFFIGFLTSRGIGIFVAKLLEPAKILVVQLTGCLATTAVLAVWGDTHPQVAFVCCGLYGFFIASLFPTGITWLASKMDVTGSLSSAWFFGAYIGNGTFPLAAGRLIESAAGAISMMYLAAGTSVLYCAVVAVMLIIAR